MRSRQAEVEILLSSTFQRWISINEWVENSPQRALRSQVEILIIRVFAENKAKRILCSTGGWQPHDVGLQMCLRAAALCPSLAFIIFATMCNLCFPCLGWVIKCWTRYHQMMLFLIKHLRGLLPNAQVDKEFFGILFTLRENKQKPNVRGSLTYSNSGLFLLFTFSESRWNVFLSFNLFINNEIVCWTSGQTNTLLTNKRETRRCRLVDLNNSQISFSSSQVHVTWAVTRPDKSEIGLTIKK